MCFASFAFVCFLELYPHSIMDSEYCRTKLIVRYLPQDYSEKQVESLFVQYGCIKSCRIARDKHNNYSLGFGFVEYSTEESAAKGLQLNGQRVNGKIIAVDYSRRPDAAMQDANLYIKNLPKKCTLDEVNKLFSTYGSIVNSNLLFNHDKTSCGIAFVRFCFGYQAEAARCALHNKNVLPNQKLPLVVEKSLPKRPVVKQVQIPM